MSLSADGQADNGHPPKGGVCPPPSTRCRTDSPSGVSGHFVRGVKSLSG